MEGIGSGAIPAPELRGMRYLAASRAISATAQPIRSRKQGEARPAQPVTAPLLAAASAAESWPPLGAGSAACRISAVECPHRRPAAQSDSAPPRLAWPRVARRCAVRRRDWTSKRKQVAQFAARAQPRQGILLEKSTTPMPAWEPGQAAFPSQYRSARQAWRRHRWKPQSQTA